ncbi:MAG: hypothetical protein HY602_00060 [Parcubacteria group bacterium]|nr:hypothetical protein [Parcubacteria group bacterium]
MNSSLPSTVSLLRDTWKLYQQKILNILSIFAIPIVFYLFADQAGAVISSPAINLLLQFFVFLVYTWSHTALLQTILFDYKVIEAYSQSKRYIIPLLWATFLYVLILAGGLLLFVIPSLVFLIWLHFYHWVLLAENKKGFSALLQSHAYVSGYGWLIAARLAAITFILAFISSLLYIAILWLPLVWLQNLLSLMVYYILIIPLFFIYTFLIYKQLKETKSAAAPESLRPNKEIKFWLIASAVLGIIVIAAFVLFNIFLTINYQPFN